MAQLDPAAMSFLTQRRVRSVLCVPLTSKGVAIGVLAAFREAPRRFEDHEQNLLSIIASQATLAVENATLYSETRDRLEQISAMKRFTDTVLENISTGIMVVDGRMKVQLLNRAAQEMAVQMGGPLPDGAPEDHPLVRELLGLGLLRDTLESGRQHYDGEVHVRLASRSVLFEAQTSPLKDSQGQVTGAVMVFRDITEKRRLEEQVQQAQQMAMVGEMAAGAAHEIRNPLTSIRGFIQVLQERLNARGSEREYMDIVVAEIDRIDRLLQELMLLARTSLPRLAEVGLHQVLDEVCLLLSADPASERIRVVKDYDRALPPVRADQNQLRQVFLNLLTNAFQAISGRGEVTIMTRYRPERGEVQVSIKDTGMGIPPEHLQKIFTPFFTTKEHGTGMGLAVTFGIVRSHGGRIEVESAPGQGATFTLWLPLDPGRGAVAPGAGAAPNGSSRALGPAR
ncbi:MAG: PAS domain-containing protein [Acetobacteraceae bacterium]|nr:PAS domain-containing protein [Acetobacteraceae bacterium]